MTSSVSSASPVLIQDGALQGFWLEILRKLEPKIQRSQFITWFRSTAVLGLEEGTLVVGLPLPMSLNWHLEHYRAPTLQAAQELDPSIKQVVYTIDGGLKDDHSRSLNLLEHFGDQKRRKLPGRQEVKLAEGIVSKIMNPRYMMENFVVGSHSRLAYAACQAVAMQPGGK